MQIVINTSTIDVSLNEVEHSKLEGGVVTKTLAKYIRRVLATFSLPIQGIKAPENGEFITDEPNSYRLCFSRGRNASNHASLVSLDDIAGTSKVGNVVTFRNTNDIELIVECEDGSYRLENIKYTVHDKDNDIEINATFGDEYMKHISEEFMNMILALDIDAGIIGANTVVSNVIKMESIATGVSHESKMFHIFAPIVVTYNATPVFVNYTNRGFYLRDPKFATVGSYRIYVNNTHVGIGYCYAPGYVRMELDFVTCTPIRASNIVELEQCLAITSAVNEKTMFVAKDSSIETTPAANWYANGLVFESDVCYRRIDSQLINTTISASLDAAKYIGSTPGYERLYNVFAEIDRFKLQSTDIVITDDDVVNLICGGLNIKRNDSRVSDDVAVKDVRSESRNVLHRDIRKLSDDIGTRRRTIDIRDAFTIALDVHNIDMNSDRHMFMDLCGDIDDIVLDYVGHINPSILSGIISQTLHIWNGGRPNPKSSSRGGMRMSGGVRVHYINNAFNDALAATGHNGIADSRVYKRLFGDIETLVTEYEDTLNISDVGNIIACTLNNYSGTNHHVNQCDNKTLDCVISDLVKAKSDELSAGGMLEFINIAGVHDVIGNIYTYVDELRTYIVDDGKVHM